MVVLYDKDYLKKFRVYFSEPGEQVKFEHNLYAFGGFGGRARTTPDYVHTTQIAPANYDGSSALGEVALDGAASDAEGQGALGYNERYIWLVNGNENWPGGVEPKHVIAEVLCRYFHSHERMGRHIDNEDETVERALL